MVISNIFDDGEQYTESIDIKVRDV